MSEAPGAARRAYFVRSIFASHDLEVFLMTAIATILTVRSILAATGWPQLGGGKIHFAHLLWGGLGMLIALILFMAMQGRLWRRLAALSAGIGFGLFIDELGKFITSDNDYFFRPAVAFIYLIFVVLFLVARIVFDRVELSPQVALVNAFDLAKEVAARDLDDAERGQILMLLAKCDQGDAVVRDLTHLVTNMTPVHGAPDLYQRLKASLRRFYDRLLAGRWFRALLAAYLGLIAISGVVSAVVAIGVASGWSLSVSPDFWNLGQAISAGVSGVLVVAGFVRWRRSRLSAYRWFERALLVDIFIVQFFSFYKDQVAAVFGLAVVLLTYAAVRAMLREEEAREAAATRVTAPA
jgi:hypothetical protein